MLTTIKTVKIPEVIMSQIMEMRIITNNHIFYKDSAETTF